MTRMKVLAVLCCFILGAAATVYGQSCPYGESASSNCLSPRTIAGWPGQHVVLMDVYGASETGSLYNGYAYVNVGNLVYFSVTPEVTGNITVSTCHPHTLYDTVVDVVSGQEFCSGGTIHGGNDDYSAGECYVDCSGSNRASQVTFYGYAGSTYTIRVGSYNNNSDGCPLCLGLIVTIGSPCGDPPRNFICDVATEIPGTFGSHDVEADIIWRHFRVVSGVPPMSAILSGTSLRRPLTGLRPLPPVGPVRSMTRLFGRLRVTATEFWLIWLVTTIPPTRDAPMIVVQTGLLRFHFPSIWVRNIIWRPVPITTTFLVVSFVWTPV